MTETMNVTTTACRQRRITYAVTRCPLRRSRTFPALTRLDTELLHVVPERRELVDVWVERRPALEVLLDQQNVLVRQWPPERGNVLGEIVLGRVEAIQAWLVLCCRDQALCRRGVVAAGPVVTFPELLVAVGVDDILAEIPQEARVAGHPPVA